jgi:hypothetical protein
LCAEYEQREGKGIGKRVKNQSMEEERYKEMILQDEPFISSDARS